MLARAVSSRIINHATTVGVRSLHCLVRSKLPAIAKPASFPDGSSKVLDVSQYQRDAKWTLLFFYPLDWTFVCPSEIIDFSDRSPEFAAIGCQVVGASIDSVNSHLAWQGTERKKGGLGAMKIPLLADIGGHVARQLGFLVENPEDELNGIALRGTVLVDPSGTIRHLTVNDAPVGRSVDEALRLVQAFQYTDKHGEVCPSGWAPGKKAMKPNARATAEYLATLQ